METGFICNKISLGRHRTSEDVQLIQESFSRSPVKSKANASIELGLPKTTQWRVLKKRLNLKPYKLPLLHALCPITTPRGMSFVLTCWRIRQMKASLNV